MPKFREIKTDALLAAGGLSILGAGLTVASVYERYKAIPEKEFSNFSLSDLAFVLDHRWKLGGAYDHLMSGLQSKKPPPWTWSAKASKRTKIQFLKDKLGHHSPLDLKKLLADEDNEVKIAAISATEHHLFLETSEISDPTTSAVLHALCDLLFLKEDAVSSAALTTMKKWARSLEDFPEKFNLIAHLENEESKDQIRQLLQTLLNARRQRLDHSLNPESKLSEDVRHEIYMQAVRTVEEEFNGLPDLDEDRCGVPHPTQTELPGNRAPMTKDAFVPSEEAIGICFANWETAKSCGSEVVKRACRRERLYYLEAYQKEYHEKMPGGESFDLEWILECIRSREGILIDWQKGTGRLVNPRLSSARLASTPFQRDPERLSLREVLGHLLRARTWLPYHIPAFRKKMGLQAIVATADEVGYTDDSRTTFDPESGKYMLLQAQRLVLAGQQIVRAFDFLGAVERDAILRRMDAHFHGTARRNMAKAVIRNCGPPHAWDVSGVTDFTSVCTALFLNWAYQELPVAANEQEEQARTYYFHHGLVNDDLFKPIIQRPKPISSMLDSDQQKEAVRWIMRNSAPNWPIGLWDTSSAHTMEYMFSGNTMFNQPINSWNVRKVVRMRGMFMNAKAFDQPLSLWQPKALQDVSYLFWGAYSFVQDLSPWARHLDELRRRVWLEMHGLHSFPGGWRVFALRGNSVYWKDMKKTDAPSSQETMEAFQRRVTSWGPEAWGLHKVYDEATRYRPEH